MLGLKLWSAFLLFSAVICVSGARLTQAADIIANKTKIGRGWVGLILLAIVTSLPELVTGTSAVGLIRAPNIAAGNALGSCVFNLNILIVLDLLCRDKSIYARADKVHFLGAAFSVALLVLVALAIFHKDSVINLPIYQVGVSSLIVVATYFIAVISIHQYERRKFVYYGGFNE